MTNKYAEVCLAITAALGFEDAFTHIDDPYSVCSFTNSGNLHASIRKMADDFVYMLVSISDDTCCYATSVKNAHLHELHVTKITNSTPTQMTVQCDINATKMYENLQAA